MKKINLFDFTNIVFISWWNQKKRMIQTSLAEFFFVHNVFLFSTLSIFFDIHLSRHFVFYESTTSRNKFLSFFFSMLSYQRDRKLKQFANDRFQKKIVNRVDDFLIRIEEECWCFSFNFILWIFSDTRKYRRRINAIEKLIFRLFRARTTQRKLLIIRKIDRFWFCRNVVHILSNWSNQIWIFDVEKKSCQQLYDCRIVDETSFKKISYSFSDWWKSFEMNVVYLKKTKMFFLLKIFTFAIMNRF